MHVDHLIVLVVLLWLQLIVEGGDRVRDLHVEYFRTAEATWMKFRCCKSDSSDLIVLHPESMHVNKTKIYLNFTVSRSLLRIIRERSLCSAELRLFQQGQISGHTQRIEVLLGEQNVIGSKKFRGSARGWKNFDIYDAFEEKVIQDMEMVKGTRNKIRFTFKIKPHDLEKYGAIIPQFKSAVVGEHKPRIFLRVCRPKRDRGMLPRGSINKNNIHSIPEYNVYSNNPPKEEDKCSVRTLYLEFEKDMNIPSIRAPRGAYVNYCAGTCPYLWKTKNPPLHTYILGQYSEQIRDARYQPCCIPDTYAAAEAITSENQIIKLDNLIVTSCKCV